MEQKYALVKNEKIINTCVCDESWEPGEAIIKVPYDEAILLYEFLEEPSNERVWSNVQDFVSEFTMPEMAAIELSIHPVVAGLRFKLSSWRSYVEASNPDVKMGMNALVSSGIISNERCLEIFGVLPEEE